MNTSRPPTPPRQQRRPSNPQDEIPVLTSITPAMYVPIPPDFFTSFTPPTTEEEHIQASIATVDAHAKAVKANILALTKRECVRIARQAHAGGEKSASKKTGMRAEDRKAMVANLEEPARAGDRRELPGVPSLEAWPVSGPEERREALLMSAVSRTMVELKGYDRHSSMVRRVYEERLERVRASASARMDDMMDIDSGGGDHGGPAKNL